MVFTLDVIIRAQSTVIVLGHFDTKHETNEQTNKRTKNEVILVQAYSWPVRRLVFCNRQGSPSHYLNSYLDLGFCYCNCQLIQYIYKYWDANAVWFKSSHPLGLEQCSLRAGLSLQYCHAPPIYVHTVCRSVVDRRICCGTDVFTLLFQDYLLNEELV